MEYSNESPLSSMDLETNSLHFLQGQIIPLRNDFEQNSSSSSSATPQRHLLKRRNQSSEDLVNSDEVQNVSNQIKKMKLPNSDGRISEMEEEQYGNVRIKIRTLSGKTISLTIDIDEPVIRIKELLEENEGIPPDQQRLIFNGKTMADTRTAKSYNLQEGAMIHLFLESEIKARESSPWNQIVQWFLLLEDEELRSTFKRPDPS